MVLTRETPVANADRNDLKTDAIENERNQREEAVRQPGASGTPERERSPEEARREAEQRYGKTE